jgi:hypothetical protein
MIQRMARENSTQRGADMGQTIEAVRATVITYASAPEASLASWQKHLPIPEDTKKAYLRYAPSFQLDTTCEVRGPGAGPRPYTVFSLGKFLGLTKSHGRGDDKVQARRTLVLALDALELIEQKFLKESELRGLGVEVSFHGETKLRRWERRNGMGRSPGLP